MSFDPERPAVAIGPNTNSASLQTDRVVLLEASPSLPDWEDNDLGICQAKVNVTQCA